MMMKKFDMIMDALESMDDARLISIHNEYCSASNCMDDYIYDMGEFDEIMDGMTPWEVARAAYYSGKFCPAHDWFWFNGYGNLESSDFPAHDKIFTEDIADYIERNNNPLYDNEIADILNGYEEEDEE